MPRDIIYPKSKDCLPGTHEEIVFKPDVSVKGDINLPAVSTGGEYKQRGSETKICTPDNPNPPFQGPPPEQLSGAALDNAIRDADITVEDALIRLEAALKALEECKQKLEEEMAKYHEKPRRHRTLACGFSEDDPLPCPYCGEIHVNAFLDRTAGPALPEKPKTDCSAQWSAYAKAERDLELANEQAIKLMSIKMSIKNPEEQVVSGPPEIVGRTPETEGGIPRLRPPYWRRVGP
jgi:hypothetical protein